MYYEEKTHKKIPRDSDDEMFEMLSNKLVHIPSTKRLPSIYKLLHSHSGKEKTKQKPQKTQPLQYPLCFIPGFLF